MEEVTFLVQGSALEPYEVKFIKDGNKFTALCTCPAGQNGLHCKHRIGILTGSTQGIVSDNINQLETVISWLPGSDIEAVLNDVLEAEKVFEESKKILQRLKKKLARVMHD